MYKAILCARCAFKADPVSIATISQGRYFITDVIPHSSAVGNLLLGVPRGAKQPLGHLRGKYPVGEIERSEFYLIVLHAPPIDVKRLS